jgi:site-specific DNA-methyltransferase (adenine-specific)
MGTEDPFKIFQGDALKLLTSFTSESYDFVFADPPYFLSNDGFTVKSGKSVSVNKGEWDRSLGFKEEYKFHLKWISESIRVLRPNGTIAISGTYHSIFKCGFILQELGCRIINDLIWFKPNGAPSLAGRNFTASHETIIWASKNASAKHTFNYKESKSWDHLGDKLLNPGKQMRSVWSIPTTPKREKAIGNHPTQKPLEVMKRLVALCTKPEDSILDPFCGSGTTGVASVMMGRQFTGIEIDSNYAQLANARISEALNLDPPFS